MRREIVHEHVCNAIPDIEQSRLHVTAKQSFPAVTIEHLAFVALSADLSQSLDKVLIGQTVSHELIKML